MGSLRRAAGLAGGALLSGTFGYCFVDAATDALTFRILRRMAMERIEESDRVRAFVCRTQPEAPMTTGPWYDSTVRLLRSGQLAVVTFQVAGPSASTEVWVRATRPQGWRSTFLYNTLGPGQWELLSLEGTLKAEGGLAKRVSLVEAPAPKECADCETDNPKIKNPDS
uniref:Uncharacterized protein n=1 Tax=Tetraselmis chuii TaxID=63592 RepID=A0A7S1X9H0_9CHLO|mmetsp:Transcript_41542/g.74675  ORF Transcript_41542/g.74675 Transcript_41542/m.74675 type:complete len:168 (+) Transcript_41542:96-599(+)